MTKIFEKYDMDKICKDEEAYVARVSEEKLKQAAEYLRTKIPQHKIERLQEIRREAKDAKWWFSEYHFYVGRWIRNVLRDGGYGEKELHIPNLDFIYVKIIEMAIADD